MTLDDLVQPSSLRALLLEGYGPDLYARHADVLMSQWSKYYFMCFWRAVLQAWPARSAAWESAFIRVGPRGFPDAVEWVQPGGGELPEALLGLHLEPLIRHFCAHSKVPAGVFWSNAGDALEQACRGLPQWHWSHRLLVRRRFASGLRNPLQGTVRHLPEGGRTVRACCLAWQVPGIGHCEHCPLPVPVADPVPDPLSNF